MKVAPMVGKIHHFNDTSLPHNKPRIFLCISHYTLRLDPRTNEHRNRPPLERNARGRSLTSSAEQRFLAGETIKSAPILWQQRLETAIIVEYAIDIHTWIVQYIHNSAALFAVPGAWRLHMLSMYLSPLLSSFDVYVCPLSYHMRFL